MFELLENGVKILFDVVNKKLLYKYMLYKKDKILK